MNQVIQRPVLAIPDVFRNLILKTRPVLFGCLTGQNTDIWLLSYFTQVFISWFFCFCFGVGGVGFCLQYIE